MLRTRLSALPPSRALLVLLVVVAATAWFVAIGVMLPPDPVAGPAHGDLDTYAEVIASLRGGVPYYEALHEALLRHGYGTLSVFNWRPPAFLSLLAALPSLASAQVLLVALCLGALATTARLLSKESGPVAAIAGTLLVAASLAACLAPKGPLMCELYAGALILLSASANGLGRRWLGLVAAMLALLFRELAAPYVLICAVLAWREGRRAEARTWVAAIAAYCAYYAWHATNVLAALGPADTAGPGWLTFGGATFVLLAATFNGLFLVLPYWLSALLLPLAVLGLVAWPGRARTRFLWPVVAYLALFAVAGRPVNSYWGALVTPLLTTGLVFAPAALRDLLKAMRPARARP